MHSTIEMQRPSEVQPDGKQRASLPSLDMQPSRKQRANLPSLDAFDGEFGGLPPDESAPERQPDSRLRVIALVSLLAAISVVGVSVVAWSLSAGRSSSKDQAESSVRERNGLRKQVGELTAARQKSAATIAALETSLQQLRQRVPPDQYWYSDLAALYYRIAEFPPTTAGAGPRTSPEMPAAEPAELNDQRREIGAPLSLLPPQ